MDSFEQKVRLKFVGEEASEGVLDFYDAAQAFLGFQRSLALTTHLVLNGTVITQAPSLKGAQIAVQAPTKGSWLVVATIVGGVGYLGTRPKDTPLGHMIYSVYDYVLQRTMGVKVDYDKTIGELIEDKRSEEAKLLSPDRLDDLAEKCETAIKEMHRPIVQSGTAESAKFSIVRNSKIVPLQTELSQETFESLDFERRTTTTKTFEGMVSSYNVNTKAGRLYIKELARTVSFKIADSLTSRNISRRLVRNMELLAAGDGYSPLKFEAYQNQSRNGRLRWLLVVNIQS